MTPGGYSATPDLEAGIALRRFVEHLQVAHLGPGRALTAEREQRGYGGRVPLEYGLYTTLCEISDPTVDLCPACGLACGGPERDPLNSTSHDDAATDPLSAFFAHIFRHSGSAA